MAALPKFSFSGWTSQSLAPKVPVIPPGVTTFESTGGLMGNTLKPLPGAAVATTNAANTNLPAWLQSEVDRLNAQQALRTQMAGQVTGQPSTAGDLGAVLQGIAANTTARTGYNAQINQLNEQARLQNLIQQRNQLRPTGGFGFNNPLDVQQQIDLDRQISGYQNVNLPLAAGAVGGFRPSGWVNPYRTF